MLLLAIPFVDIANYATHSDTANYVDNLTLNNFMPTHMSRSFATTNDRIY